MDTYLKELQELIKSVKAVGGTILTDKWDVAEYQPPFSQIPNQYHEVLVQAKLKDTEDFDLQALWDRS